MAQKIQLVVFDWAGTTTDFGSLAPVHVFDETFSEYGLHFTKQEISAPMGMEKREHIRTMLSTERGTALWQAARGKAWTEEDVDEVYERFEQNLRRVVAEYSKVIPGVAETVARLREMGIQIGSTTGYTSEIMRYVLPVAQAGGYDPDCIVTPDVVGYSRPAPFMVYECMRQTGIWPAKCVVKVGDTVVDMQEGKTAGAWSIGVVKGSNLMGLSEEEYHSAAPKVLQEKAEAVREIYRKAGADLVIGSILELPAAIELLNARMEAQEA